MSSCALSPIWQAGWKHGSLMHSTLILQKKITCIHLFHWLPQWKDARTPIYILHEWWNWVDYTKMYRYCFAHPYFKSQSAHRLEQLRCLHWPGFLFHGRCLISTLFCCYTEHCDIIKATVVYCNNMPTSVAQPRTNLHYCLSLINALTQLLPASCLGPGQTLSLKE